MAHHIIDGSADRTWKTVVVQRCWNGVLHVDNVVVTDTVQFSSGHAHVDLGNDQRLNEMEFHLPIDEIQPASISHFLSEHGYPVSTLSEEGLSGYLKGYIDLVAEVDGCYIIIDYKSNFLGGKEQDYAADELPEAMVEGRYHLQYLLYTVALHRYLSQRLPEYSYEEHFGGILYLFVRGMSPDSPPGNGVFADRPGIDLIRGLDELLKGERA